MSSLRDHLDDLARDPGHDVRIDVEAAWSSGQRRRAGRRMRTAAFGVAAVAIAATSLPLASEVTSMPSSADGDAQVASHYPQRLDYVYRDSSLPADSGPLAGVVQRSHEDFFGSWAVSPGGRMWRIEDVYGESVSISPDGVHLVYLKGKNAADANLAITDQTTGHVTRFDEISLGATDAQHPEPRERYFHSDQMPAFWNAGSSAVFLQLGDYRARRDTVAAGVLGTDGSMTIIRNSRDLPSGSQPVGWFSTTTVGFVKETKSAPRVMEVDVRTGRVTRTFALHDPEPFVSQWYASLSPDGNEIMTRNESEGSQPFRFFSARGSGAGSLRTKMPVPSDLSGPCQPTWTSTDVYLPTDSNTGDNGSVLYRVNGGHPIVADPRLGAGCSVWAARALEGGPERTLGGLLFGTDSTWLSWHWRELSAALAALLAVGLGVGAFRIRRR
ncbi:hypothetical protein [Nocardioides jejuensis]|uniref:Uncharacterized protein n=1 Tax=Nocardioides jejuensis TaxID=2502782 RepID=A0A4V6NB86_9ACTN|nr:hypothetical protein [Nocardioides jejuensis]TCJ23692.1 hypothetical protein EPD65_10510 [Nocardioides jejuensis]